MAGDRLLIEYLLNGSGNVWWKSSLNYPTAFREFFWDWTVATAPIHGCWLGQVISLGCPISQGEEIQMKFRRVFFFLLLLIKRTDMIIGLFFF